ncbi:MAG: diguanylate cyclase domain-containing protein [Giesbergeria sp.]
MSSLGGVVDAGSSLRDVVHRAHARMALISVSLAALLLMLAGLVALRVLMVNNLELVGRSLAYTVEAAVVFGDRGEASSILARMVSGEGVSQAMVLDAQGKVFVAWTKDSTHLRARVGRALAEWTRLPLAVAPIHENQAAVGQVVLRSDGQGLLTFVATGALALIVCLALAGGVGVLLSRRMLRDIVVPLQDLARVAREARRDRALDQRVPPARIAELRSLGDDFNALLQELELRQAQLERQNRELAHRAHHDSLTGLPNRAYFEPRLSAAIDAVQASDEALAVLFLDNDHFKQINDQHGHAVGDALLVEVAQRVRAQLRETDVVARIGGDEFAVLLAPVRGADDALRIADKILDAMETPLAISNWVSLAPSVSIGVAIFPEHGQTTAELLRSADTAMYHAKTRRRGTRHVATTTQ